MSTTVSPSAHRSAAPAPQPHDFLGLDALMTDDERLIRDTVRAFVRDRVLPNIGDWFDEGVFPREMARELGNLGLLGMHLQGYGCAGTSAVAYGLACLELEAGDSGFRSFVSVQGSLAMYALWAHGSEEQKQTWLPRMAAGEAIGCFGLTEPDFGSDPGGMRTTAKRSGSRLRAQRHQGVDHQRRHRRRGDGLGRTDPDDGPRSGTIRGFVVPTNTKGFSTRNVERKLSLRASITSELILEDVRLPADAMLPNVEGLRGPLSCLNEARYGIMWGALGAGRACYESALEYAKTRVQFGRPSPASSSPKRSWST